MTVGDFIVIIMSFQFHVRLQFECLIRPDIVWHIPHIIIHALAGLQDIVCSWIIISSSWKSYVAAE